MCESCWAAEGSPTNLPKGWEALVRTARKIDPYGEFHIVVEDFNIEDHHIESCIKDSKLEFERAWGRKMLELSIEQRAAVLAKMDKFF